MDTSRSASARIKYDSLDANRFLECLKLVKHLHLIAPFHEMLYNNHRCPHSQLHPRPLDFDFKYVVPKVEFARLLRLLSMFLQLKVKDLASFSWDLFIVQLTQITSLLWLWRRREGTLPLIRKRKRWKRSSINRNNDLNSMKGGVISVSVIPDPPLSAPWRRSRWSCTLSRTPDMCHGFGRCYWPMRIEKSLNSLRLAKGFKWYQVATIVTNPFTTKEEGQPNRKSLARDFFHKVIILNSNAEGSRPPMDQSLWCGCSHWFWYLKIPGDGRRKKPVAEERQIVGNSRQSQQFSVRKEQRSRAVIMSSCITLAARRGPALLASVGRRVSRSHWSIEIACEITFEIAYYL